VNGDRWVLDASALKALFDGHDELYSMLQSADAGRISLFLPTVAIAEAETSLLAGKPGWRPFLLSRGLRVLDLDLEAAIELGAATGPLDARHASREALALGATVLTRNPAAYEWLAASLRAV
jgi:predicted nucleic acid-binding protein